MPTIESFQHFKRAKMNKLNHMQTYLLTVLVLLLCTFLALSVEAHSILDNTINGDNNGGTNSHLANRQTNGGKSMQTSNHHGNQNRCQSGWMWFNNKCWVATQSRRDFVHAVELCKKMYNSTLPTIHSVEENEFLRQNIDLHNSPIWLFARHNHQYNKTRWLDKTQVNYTNWDAGQPNDKSSLVCIKTEDGWFMKKPEQVGDQTECVSFWEDSKWGTQVGCLVLLPVVCEKKLTPISRYSDGPNGTMSSQFEQQQMYPMSAATTTNNYFQFTTIVYLIIATLFSALSNNPLEFAGIKQRADTFSN